MGENTRFDCLELGAFHSSILRSLFDSRGNSTLGKLVENVVPKHTFTDIIASPLVVLFFVLLGLAALRLFT